MDWIRVYSRPFAALQNLTHLHQLCGSSTLAGLGQCIPKCTNLDLLLIASGPEPSRELEVRACASLRGLGIPAGILCYTPELVTMSAASPNRVVARALREGQVLYERPH